MTSNGIKQVLGYIVSSSWLYHVDGTLEPTLVFKWPIRVLTSRAVCWPLDNNTYYLPFRGSNQEHPHRNPLNLNRIFDHASTLEIDQGNFLLLSASHQSPRSHRRRSHWPWRRNWKTLCIQLANLSPQYMFCHGRIVGSAIRWLLRAQDVGMECVASYPHPSDRVSDRFLGPIVGVAGYQWR